MQTLDFVSGLRNYLEFSQPRLVFLSGYANTENLFYCLTSGEKRRLWKPKTMAVESLFASWS